MKTTLLKEKIESWEQVKSVGGTVFSFEELMTRVFGLSQDEINKNFKQIKKEMHSKKYDLFYKLADIEIASENGLAGMTDAEGNPLSLDDMGAGVFVDKDNENQEKPKENPKDTENHENPKAEENNVNNDNNDKTDFLSKFGL